MYFELDGKIDVALMLDSHRGGINSKKFCEQILTNNIKVVNHVTSTELNIWKDYYKKMHPKPYLTEDILPDGISQEEIKKVFEKFFGPLSAYACPLTIIDPYIFATNTDADLLISILESNVTSKQVRFVTTMAHSNDIIKNEITSRLQTLGFTVRIEDRTDIHDRWWYTRIKGFSCGTSFNGISRKTTMLNMFSDHDLTDIIAEFGI